MAGGPGRSEREGLTLAALFQQFPDDATAEAWFAAGRWPDGPTCPHCDHDSVKSGAKHPTMPYRCRGCKKYFSVKTGTVMEGSNLGYQTWAIAIYRMTTSLRGVSSMQLHRDLGISQKAAWHLAHRIRQAFGEPAEPMVGPVEVDETFIGGKEGNKHETKRRGNMGHDGKVAVIGAKDRATGRVRAEVIGKAEGPRLREFVRRSAAPKATVYSDGHAAYTPLDGEFTHRAVQHAAGTYVIFDTHTNGIEGFWSQLKRGYHGTFSHWSAKHTHRYLDEFVGRHNARPRDTIDQMASIAKGMTGKRLRYADLVA